MQSRDFSQCWLRSGRTIKLSFARLRTARLTHQAFAGPRHAFSLSDDPS
jgi:hypothetical protein